MLRLNRFSRPSSPQPPPSPALSNYLILTEIASYLNIKDLLSAKLVCKTWTPIFNNELSKRDVTIEFCNGQKLEIFVKDFNNQILSNIVPYNCYIFNSINFSLDERLVDNFTKLEFLKIKELVIIEPKISINAGGIRSILAILKKFAKSLEKVMITFPKNFSKLSSGFIQKRNSNNNEDKEEEEEEEEYHYLKKLNTLDMCISSNINPEFLKDFLTLFTFATTFSFEFKNRDFTNNLDSIFDFMSKCKLPRLENLKIFYDCDRYKYYGIKDEQINKLNMACKRIKLKTLELPIIHKDTNPSVITKLLTTLSPSLQYLDMNYSPPFELPLMRNLECFNIKNWDYFGQLSYILCCLPKLNTINLRCNADTWEEMVPALRFKHVNNVKRLSLAYAFNSENGFGLFTNLTTYYFYNLRELEFVARDEYIKIIYKNLPRLKRITLFDAHNLTDSGITGFTLSDCRHLKSLSRTLQSNFKLDLFCGYEGIRLLKELEIFEIDCNCRGLENLTDISVLHGFRFLKNLKTLSLQNSRITDLSVNVLSNDLLDLEDLDLSNCDFLTAPTLRNIQIKRPKLNIVKPYFESETVETLICHDVYEIHIFNVDPGSDIDFENHAGIIIV